MVDKAVQQRWTLNAQWTDCPEHIIEQVKQMWDDFELGNDFCMIKCVVDIQMMHDYSDLYDYLLEQGVPYKSEIWIHWWW